MAGLQDFRAKYPQYNDMSDEQLLDGLYNRHYTDMPREEFNQKMGVAKAAPQDDQAGLKEFVRAGEQARTLGWETAKKAGLGLVSSFYNAQKDPFSLIGVASKPDAFQNDIAAMSGDLDKRIKQAEQPFDQNTVLRGIPGQIAKFGVEAVSNPASYVPLGKGKVAAEAGEAAVRGFIPRAVQAVKNIGSGVAEGAKMGAKSSIVNQLFTPDGTPNAPLLQKVEDVGLETAMGAAFGVAAKGAGKLFSTIIRAPSHMLSGAMNSLEKQGYLPPEWNVGKTEASKDYKILMNAGIDPNNLPDDPKGVQDAVFGQRDKIVNTILDSVSPKGAMNAKGDVGRVQIGQDFFDKHQKAVAAKDAAWKAVEQQAQGKTVTLYPNNPMFKKLDDLSERVEKEMKLDPAGTGRTAVVLDDIKKWLGYEQYQNNQPVKVNVSDMLDAVKAKNRIYDKVSDVPQTLLADLGKIVNQELDGFKKADPRFAKLHAEAIAEQNKYARTYQNKTAQRLGLDEDVIQAFNLYNKGFPLNNDARNALVGLPDKIKTTADISQLVQLLGRDGARPVMHAKMAELMAESALDPDTFSQNKEMMNEILSLTSGVKTGSKQQLTKLEQLNDMMSRYGIKPELKEIDEASLSPEQVKSAKKALVGAITKHYMFAVSQARDVFLPPQSAAERRLRNFGMAGRSGTPYYDLNAQIDPGLGFLNNMADTIGYGAAGQQSTRQRK